MSILAFALLCATVGAQPYNVVFNNNNGGGSCSTGALPAFLAQLTAAGINFTTAADALAKSGRDYGNIYYRQPAVVVWPRSTQEVQLVVQGVRFNKLWLSVQGAQHSTSGQSQVYPAGGVAVSLANMQRIRQTGADWIEIEGGTRWQQVLDATEPQGRAPNVIPAITAFTVGGTLSGGGLGNNGFLYGAQIDNVVQLEVVDGTGGIHSNVSATQEQGLFDAVRGGLGQFGIITAARIRTRAIPGSTRTYNIFYSDPQLFMADSLTALGKSPQPFTRLQGQIFINNPLLLAAQFPAALVATLSAVSPPPPLWYMLGLAVDFVAGSPPNDATVLAGLTTTIMAPNTELWFDAVRGYQQILTQAAAAGIDKLPHPWLPVWLPNDPSTLGYFLSNIVPQLLAFDPTTVVSFGPTLRAPFTAPNFRIPPTPIVWLAYLAGSASSQTTLQQMMQFNQQQLRQLLPKPAYRYPVDALPEVALEGGWAAFHFQERWPDFVAAKKTYDPDHILNGGQMVFARVTK